MLGCEKLQDQLQKAVDDAIDLFADRLIDELEYDNLIHVALDSFKEQVGNKRFFEALTRHDSSQ